MVPDGRKYGCTDDAKTISLRLRRGGGGGVGGGNKNDPQKKHCLGKYMHEVMVSRCIKVPHVKGVVR